jgi:hemerythrin-like domain-containing protein
LIAHSNQQTSSVARLTSSNLVLSATSLLEGNERLPLLPYHHPFTSVSAYNDPHGVNLREKKNMVLPIGPLMIEHRLIERMISVMQKELERTKKEKTADPRFIDTAVNFIRIYADQCHHGKEEKIMFRDLEKKVMKPNDKHIMEELIQEHVQARKLTGQLVEAKTKYETGNEASLLTIIDIMSQLVEFYPKHIEKEDKVFFKPAMKYLTKQEQNAMLEEEYEFDRNFIHVVYKNIVVQAEEAHK